jgi:lysophospholipase L1-like esterase
LRLLAVPLILSAALAAISFADNPSGPARWEADMKKFEAKDEATPPPKGGILFVGSSSIRMWDLKKSFPDLDAINRGFGGSEIPDSTYFADRIIIKHEPKLILLYAGDNDISKGRSAEETFENFKTFATKVRGSLPETKIIFIAIKPSAARWKLWPEMNVANALIARHASKTDGIDFADIASPMIGTAGPPPDDLFVKDGLHLSERGYALWVEVIRPMIDSATAK